MKQKCTLLKNCSFTMNKHKKAMNWQAKAPNVKLLRIHFTLILSCCLFIPTPQAQTTLSVGDASILWYSADIDDFGTDDFGFVTFVDLAVDTRIYFSERGASNAGAFGTSGEAVLLYQVTSAITAGTIIAYNDNTLGTWSQTAGNTMDLSVSGDQLFIFQDGDGPGGTAPENNPVFIHGFNAASRDLTDNCDENSGLRTDSPSSLAAVTFGGPAGTFLAVGIGTGCNDENSHLHFTGGISYTTIAAAKADIQDPDNWVGDDNDLPSTAYNTAVTEFKNNGSILSVCGNITVNSTADNLTAGDGNCTLREAIINANAGADLTSGDCDCGTTITFDASTNGSPIVLNLTGTGEDAAATGDLDITTGVTITGNGQGTTIIDGNAADRVIDILTSSQVTIQGMTIQNGRTTDLENGGGIQIGINQANVSIAQVSFNSNETQNSNINTERGGGGVSISGADQTVSIDNCNFTNNATEDRGGGLFIKSTGSSNITLNNLSFSSNTADNDGGGIASFGGVSISSSCFQSNGADSEGGAIFLSNGDHSISNCTFTANTAPVGAALSQSSNVGILNVTNSTFSDNVKIPGIEESATVSLTQNVSNQTANFKNNIIINTVGGDDLKLKSSTVLNENVNNIVGSCDGGNCPTFFSTNTDVICGIATCGNGLCHYPVRAGSDADGTADVSNPIADDICGNARNAGAYNIGSSEEDFTDTEDPVVTCPGNVSQNADVGQCNAVVSYTGATSTDNCGVVMVSSTPASGSTFNVGATTVTATASDAAGNMGQCTFTVTVVDNQAPTVNCPANQTVYAAPGMTSTTVNGIAPTGANDNCSIASTTYSIMGATTTTGNNDASGTTFNLGMSNVAYTVTDPAGLTGMCSFTVTVVQCGDITVNSSADNLTAGDGNCTLREAINNVNAGTDLTQGDCDCGNTIRFAASTNGNPITIALAGANENGNATGDFDINAGVTIIGNGTSNTIIDGADLDRIFDVGTTDAVSIQTLTIQNGTADDFGGGILCATQFADITLDQVNVDNCEALSGGGISISFTSISLAMTSCSVTNNMATIGSGGGLEFYGSSMMVSDCAFNNNISGTTGGGAEISTPGGTVNFLRTCFVGNTAGLIGGGINHLNGNVTFTNCTFSDNEASIGQGGALSSFAFPGTNLSVINCTAAENTAAVGGGFNITQNGGNIDMINTILADNTASGGSGHDLYIDAGTLTTNTNNIVEDCLGNTTNAVVCPTFFSSDDPQLQPITTCGALCYYPLLDCSTAVGAGDQNATGVPTTDICGTAHGAATNIGSSEATTGDTENPVANCPGSQTVSNTAGQCGANVSFTIPNPTDNCSATSAASPASGSFFNVGTTQVTVTATDGGGNTDQCTFNVVINDNEDPTVSCPSDITVSVDDATNCTAVVNYTTPTASDNCSGVGAVSCSPASGSVFALGSNTVTCSVTDNAGNTGQCTFNVIVQQPDIMVKGDYAPIMNGSTIISGNIATSSSNGQTWTYQLENLSTASGDLIITSVSVDNPAFDLTQPAQTSLAPGEMTSFDIQFNPQGNEVCNIQDATVTIISNDCNDATFTFAIQGEISDNEDPTVSCPSDITVSVDDAANCTAVVNYTTPTASDNCFWCRSR
jgi:CSLREA domain-containing protein